MTKSWIPTTELWISMTTHKQLWMSVIESWISILIIEILLVFSFPHTSTDNNCRASWKTGKYMIWFSVNLKSQFGPNPGTNIFCETGRGSHLLCSGFWCYLTNYSIPTWLGMTGLSEHGWICNMLSYNIVTGACRMHCDYQFLDIVIKVFTFGFENC